MEILKLIFHNFWTFIGTLLLLGLLFRGFGLLLRGYPPPTYSDGDIVAAYKLGKIDQKNGNHMDDRNILSDIKAILKDGSRTSNSK